jgi:hypothetical protein
LIGVAGEERSWPFYSFYAWSFGRNRRGIKVMEGNIKIKQRRDNRERNKEIGNILQNSFKT